jgi:SAM-dependent methyltransferase
MAPADAQPVLKHLYPALHDNTGLTYVEPIYFYQDAWAFEKIVKARPPCHIDVGSHHRTIALLSKVLPVTMVDLRPLSLPLDTLSFREGSILDLPYEDHSVESLSCLCVVEHIGLGRYGDPLDPHGSAKAIAELKRVLAPGGRLYFSVPIGDQDVVAFNAGRVFGLERLRASFAPLEIVEECYIVGSCLQEAYESGPLFGTTGLFELTKPQS